MNKHKYLIGLLVVCCLLHISSFAQKLYPLHGNANLMDGKTPNKKGTKAINGKTPRPPADSLITSIALPFYDDFGYAGPYPDAGKWLNQFVYINNTKAMAAPNMGVATFDGLDQYGFPYNPHVTSSGQTIAPAAPSDTLTSYPIRLDSIPGISQLSPLDNVYLSFYYQGMGYWEYPLSNYELDLDFYSPIDSAWYQVWSVAGSATNYKPDSMFHLVMIPITDSSYFGNGFQFRFRNLSCACGDDDHWHLDQIKLDRQRSDTDTIISDISFVYDLQSLLKNYTQMPYNQYTGASDMKDSISAFLRSNFYNHGNTIHKTAVGITTYYNIYNATGTSLRGTNTPPQNGSGNIYPYYDTGYCKSPLLIHPSLNGFLYPTPMYSDSITTKFFISSAGSFSVSPDAFPYNDTNYYHQVFKNYFAYDDGSAEAAFGLESINCPGNYQTAALYTLNKPDRLRAIDIFFDPVIDVDTLKGSPFNLMVWSNNNGVPGNLIYTDTAGGNLRYPYFSPDTIIPSVQRVNHFNRYQLLHSIPLDSGAFFIGINQVYNYPAIPIGFDMNTDHHNNFFYSSFDLYCNPSWIVFPGDEDPSYRGSLMMRPVLGDSLLALGIKKYNNTVSANIIVYPNPATDEVFIQSENTITKVVVTDLIGNLVIQQAEHSVQSINTASLQSGAYLIKAFTDKGLTDTKKLIISR